ncbi:MULTISPECIES: S8 family serine peptidase [unclassified Sphingomonas]|uniref:S8 family serine peptidase n=1 Tax=unclassified Sphingomonas TaxID=196159 RepID=UPI000A745C4A|nr:MULTISPECIES: S8 family serine peptidase [unclassified Sphingomonas]
MHFCKTFLVAVALVATTGGAVAQLLPPVGGAIGQAAQGIGRLGETVGDGLSETVDRTGGLVDRLARQRIGRLDALVRRNPQALEIDERGDPAVKGELILVDATPQAVQAATRAGFALIGQEAIEGLDIRTARLRAPEGMSLARAERRLRKLTPGIMVQSNPIYQPSGAAAATPARGATAPAMRGPGAPIGLIDGGIASHPALPAGIVQRGFARGAPAPGDHGTAIASILVGRGAVRGVSPESRLFAADVFGPDPAGGSALAIARALGWLTANEVAVVNISLAGPDNPLLARAVAAADRRGLLMVAAVGNDGAAAPPAFPASYPQVIAVTGVDTRERPLIEAGKARHLDFAAPGAGLIAATAGGATATVRGTSYAAAFVAGRLARLSAAGRPTRAHAIALLAAEARGKGRLIGRGIVCAGCATH